MPIFLVPVSQSLWGRQLASFLILKASVLGLRELRAFMERVIAILRVILKQVNCALVFIVVDFCYFSGIFYFLGFHGLLPRLLSLEDKMVNIRLTVTFRRSIDQKINRSKASLRIFFHKHFVSSLL